MDSLIFLAKLCPSLLIIWKLFWLVVWPVWMLWWLMVLCTINPHILTSIYSGTVTITSQPNLMSSKPSPIGPPWCVASLSCSNKKRNTSGRLSTNANTPNGLWTRCRKDSTGLLDRSMMGAKQGAHCHTLHTRSL